MKNQKGITLVALVVTIVVLLILAGVTIALVMQGDSIFGKAEDAKEKTNLDAVKSAVGMAILELQTNYHDPATKSKVDTAEEAVTEIKKYMPSNIKFTKDPSFTGYTPAEGESVNFYFTGAEVTVTGGSTFTVSYTATEDLKVEEKPAS